MLVGNGYIKTSSHWLSNSDCRAQLSKYLCEVEDHSLTTSATSNTLDFWIQREHVYDKLSLVAEDILTFLQVKPTLNVYLQFVDC